MVATLEQVFREEWGRVLATLIGVLGDFDLAEDADQDGQDAAPLLAEDLVERRYQYTSEGRISTAPP